MARKKPDSDLPDNWKDFLITNPWAPPRLIKELYPSFNEYDLTNWKKKKT